MHLNHFNVSLNDDIIGDDVIFLNLVHNDLIAADTHGVSFVHNMDVIDLIVADIDGVLFVFNMHVIKLVVTDTHGFIFVHNMDVID